LWQINSVHGSLSTTNPLENAKAAVKIEGTQGLTAWTVYKTGAYKRYLQGNVAPDSSGLPSGSTPVAGNASQADFSGAMGEALGLGLATGIGAVVQPIMRFIIWGTEILLGGGLVIVGLFVFISNTNAGKQASSIATTAVLPEERFARVTRGTAGKAQVKKLS
jgi:hypothetical protein